MEPVQISWIVAIVAGSIVAKFLGLVMKGRDPGLIAGPLLGIVGGVLLWQGAILSGMADGADLVLAGIFSAVGGFVLYMAVALLRSKA
ncbi:hypothetical protein [Hyphomonas sp.]|uniref:hypothetical protein n=1 Tax=Hyphomonas sp. TaxID=87 RepID=UPI003F6EE7F0